MDSKSIIFNNLKQNSAKAQAYHSAIRNYILRKGLAANLLIGFFMNIVINTAIGLFFAILNGFKPFPLFGPMSIASDFIGMTFTLTLLVSWSNIDTAREEILRLPWKKIKKPKGLQRLFKILPFNKIIRALILSVFFTVVTYPIIYLLQALKVTEMSVITFITFKAIYSGILAVFVILASSVSVSVKGR